MYVLKLKFFLLNSQFPFQINQIQNSHRLQLKIYHAALIRIPRWMGCASSLTRDEILAFLADSLTLNASGLNCTKSIDSRTIGCDKIFNLSDTRDFIVDRGIRHSTSRFGKNPSVNCFGLESSCTRWLATAFNADFLTTHAGPRVSPSLLFLGRARSSVRELACPRKTFGDTAH